MARGEEVCSRIDAQMRVGYVFNSNPVLMNRMEPDGTVTHTAMSWHLRYSFCRPQAPRIASVYQGVGVSATSFGQRSGVGSPFGLYVLQGAPIVVLSDRLSLDYEWNFGATFGWHRTMKDDAIRSNLVVGSSTNAYINLGLKLNYQPAAGIMVSSGLDLTHYSNGNTSWPNPGVNSIGGAIGLTFIPGKKILQPISPFASDPDFIRRFSFDITAYGAWRKAYFPAEDAAFTVEGERALLPGHFGVAGLALAPMIDLHPTFRTGLSVDLQWSENTGLDDYRVPDTYGDDVKFYRPPFLRQLSFGLSARAELVMPIFSINIGIGYGIAGPPETRRLYQTATLKTYIAGPLYLNIGYRMVEFRSPSNLMLGLGLTLR